MTGIDDSMVNVRYLVDDVEAALDFYTTHLGFTVRTAHLPAFADITRGNLRMLLSGPASRLRAAGVNFRNDIVTGPGGQQVLLEDPSGNPIELFVPAASQ
jgi:hypothetical protein